MLFCIIMMILSIPWNRFIWPIIVKQIGGMLGGGVVNAQTNVIDRGPITERATVIAKILLSMWFWLFPRMFLTTVPFILLLDCLQVIIVILNARKGVSSFGWIFNFGGRNSTTTVSNNTRYNNQGVGDGTYNGRVNNGNQRQKVFDRQNLMFNRNLSESQSAGKKDGEELWLVRGSKKVYINATGKVVYSYQKQEYSLQGTELYEQNGVKVYAIKLDGTTESLTEKMNSIMPVMCETAAFFIDLKGKYYFITNQGELIRDILNDYKSYAVTENTRVRELESGHCILESVLENGLPFITDLSQYHDVLQIKLSYTMKLDVAATVIENNGRDLVYQFESIEPYSLIPPQRDLMDEDGVKSDEELNQEKPAAGKINGIDAWRVEGLKGAFILANGHFFIKYNGDKREYTNDEEKIVNSVKSYLFIWDDSDTEFVEFLSQQLDEVVRDKCKKQGDFRLLISRYGTLYNPSVESEKSNITNLLEEEAGVERITMQDLKDQLDKGVKGMKALKAKTEEIQFKLKNKGMVQDGVYNTGVVDLMCQYGELRCCYYSMGLPVVQAIYVGRLIASYAINNILDKISSNWNEDVEAEQVHLSIVDDIESIIGQQDTAIVNSWVVKDDQAYYMSIVLDLRDAELAREQLMSIRRSLMGILVNTMQFSMQDEVCYITNIVKAEETKLIKDSYDDEVTEMYYKVNYIETVPSIFKRQFYAMNNEDIKRLQSEFNKECDVLFKIRYPLVEGYKYEEGRYMKFMAEDNLLHQLEEQEKVQLIDLSTQGASITKLCTYLDGNIFGSKVHKNKVKSKWRKDYFAIRIRSEKGFEFSFFSYNENFFSTATPFMSALTVPLISCAFWTAEKKCVLDTEKPEVVLYMFHRNDE